VTRRPVEGRWLQQSPPIVRTGPASLKAIGLDRFRHDSRGGGAGRRDGSHAPGAAHDDAANLVALGLFVVMHGPRRHRRRGSRAAHNDHNGGPPRAWRSIQRERHIVYQTIIERQVVRRQQIVVAPPVVQPPLVQRQVALRPPIVAADGKPWCGRACLPLSLGAPPNVPLYAMPQNVALSVPAAPRPTAMPISAAGVSGRTSERNNRRGRDGVTQRMFRRD